jgi:hypothetical protein
MRHRREKQVASAFAIRAGPPTLRRSGAIEALDVITDAGEQLEAFLRCRRTHGLEVARSEADVGIGPVGVFMEMKEGSRPQVEVRTIPTHIHQAVDRTERRNQLGVGHRRGP